MSGRTSISAARDSFVSTGVEVRTCSCHYETTSKKHLWFAAAAFLPWISMDIYGHLWTSMQQQMCFYNGYPWIFTTALAKTKSTERLMLFLSKVNVTKAPPEILRSTWHEHHCHHGTNAIQYLYLLLAGIKIHCTSIAPSILFDLGIHPTPLAEVRAM